MHAAPIEGAIGRDGKCPAPAAERRIIVWEEREPLPYRLVY